MKKLLLIAIALTLGLGLKAQCPYTTATDFTATDIHGTVVHLFDILDGGQYVLIDFFFTTCGPCQQATPKIRDSYTAMGCNIYDVFYMEIATGDSDQNCINWVNNYGIEYPTISGVGGGTAICNQYGISQYPTVILIAPDRSIVIQDLWPISNAQTIITALEQHGLQQHDCDGPNIFPTVYIEVNSVNETEVTATFTPLEACTMYYYTLATEADIQQAMSTTGLDLSEYLQHYGFAADDIHSHTFTDLTPNTDYVIYAVPSDENNIFYDVVQEPVTTLGPSFEETLTFDTDTLWMDNGNTPLYIYNNTAEPVVHLNKITINTEMPWFFFLYGNEEIHLDEEFDIPIAQGQSIQLEVCFNIWAKDMIYPVLSFENTLATVTLVTAFDDYIGLQETAASVTLFPNPANESLTLKGENLGLVSVYNTLGQKIEEFLMEGDELSIATAKYENGLYIVKSENGKTMRFVVKH